MTSHSSTIYLNAKCVLNDKSFSYNFYDNPRFSDSLLAGVLAESYTYSRWYMQLYHLYFFRWFLELLSKVFQKKHC